ncbi:MAG: universal stress protein [Desulfofustis sp.]|nr:universal stress protein [Desulfofustis sp.]
MYKKVLVPLDGSELAECTLSHVKNLVKEGSVGEVTLLNVVILDLSWSHLRSEYSAGIDINAIRETLFARSSKYLADKASQLQSEGITVKTEAVEANRPADKIAEYAQEKNMDLIVIGTHGYTGFKKLMMGSVAFSVLHQSHIPVLLIRPESCRI